MCQDASDDLLNPEHRMVFARLQPEEYTPNYYRRPDEDWDRRVLVEVESAKVQEECPLTCLTA